MYGNSKIIMIDFLCACPNNNNNNRVFLLNSNISLTSKQESKQAMFFNLA